MPQRRCVACRRTGPKTTLVRLITAGGVVRVDHLAREPGRGAYLCGRPECTDAALGRDGALLKRALRTAPAVVIDGGGIRAYRPPEAAADPAPKATHNPQHPRPSGAPRSD